MSLYVRVFNSFYTHRKTARLRGEIGSDALWVVPRLWAYAATNQPDGNFSEYTPEEIAVQIGYTGNAQALLEALTKHGFLDTNPLRIHDWQEHNGYHVTFAGRAQKAAQARWNKENPSSLSDSPFSLKGERKERRGKETSNAWASPSQQDDAKASAGLRRFPSEMRKDAEAFKQQKAALIEKFQNEPDEVQAGIIKSDIDNLTRAIEDLETQLRGFPLKSGFTPQLKQAPKKQKGPNI